MKKQTRCARLGLVVLCLLCAVAFAIAMAGMTASAQTFSGFEDVRDTTLRATSAYTVCLPLVRKHGPPRAKLGVDFGPMATDDDVLDYDLPVVKEMGADWVRVFLGWLEIERAPGEYTWDEYDPVFDRLGELEVRSKSF
jgi:hypothetical protein